MKKPYTEFTTDFESLLLFPATYIDWEGCYFSIYFGWLFWNIKFEWEKKP